MTSLVGTALGLELMFYTAAGLALVAALLDAVFNCRLGCGLYLLGRRLFGKAAVA